MIQFRRNMIIKTQSEAVPVYKRGPGVELERTCKSIQLVVIEGLGTSGLRVQRAQHITNAVSKNRYTDEYALQI